ncbi:MAG: lamin tail domain-containing protein [bacterium]
MRSIHFFILVVLTHVPAMIFSQIVLTEVMFDPAVSESTDEFVEIVNLNQSQTFNLEGWTLGDGNATDTIVDAGEGLVLQPGQYAVILDRDYFGNSTSYDLLIPEEALVLTIDGATFGSGGLSNSMPETVVLYDAVGRMIAQYTYSTGNTAGYSDEKIDLSGSDDPENWADSRVFHGTPGFRNSVALLSFDLCVSQLWSEPDRAREGDDVVLWASVVNRGREAAEGFSVQFFEDLNGDSIFDNSEKIESDESEGLSLGPDDSVSVSVAWLKPRPGIRSIGACADYPLDEHPEDNIRWMDVFVGFSHRALVINEIMYGPSAGQPEWFEIFNPTDVDVDIRGWMVSDSDTSAPILITAERSTIPASGYTIVSADSSLLRFFLPWDGSFFVLADFPNLKNEADAITLFDPTGSVIDRVDYTSDWGGGGGISLERINPTALSDDSKNWNSCVLLEGATPGCENSVYMTALPPQATVSVFPNPFSPDGDGFEDETVISFSLPMKVARVNLRVYDVRGRCVRTLLGAAPTGSRSSVRWNGSEDGGGIARMGIYVIFLEGIDSAAGVIVSVKGTVVLAGRL